MNDKTRESRLRRMAARHDLMLMKSRARDPDRLDYGLYALVDIRTNGTVNPSLAGTYNCSWDLDDVEGYLKD